MTLKHVRIDVPGWEKFTGSLGSLPFEDGVSTRPAEPDEVRRIGASIRLVEADSNEQIGPSVIMADIGNVSAVVTPALERGTDEPTPAPKTSATEERVIEVKVEDRPKRHTEESLLEIADKGGIKGIREIAATMDIKGIQIASMIAEILEKQG